MICTFGQHEFDISIADVGADRVLTDAEIRSLDIDRTGSGVSPMIATSRIERALESAGWVVDYSDYLGGNIRIDVTRRAS